LWVLFLFIYCIKLLPDWISVKSGLEMYYFSIRILHVYKFRPLICKFTVFLVCFLFNEASSFWYMYLNAIQRNAHHLLRYLAIAAIVNKRRMNMLKELIKVIQQERYTYNDPVTEFLECLYVNYDFEGA
jgi:hypothetical protein